MFLEYYEFRRSVGSCSAPVPYAKHGFQRIYWLLKNTGTRFTFETHYEFGTCTYFVSWEIDL